MELADMFPGLEWEQRRPGLFRAEEETTADVDGIQPPPHWRYVLFKDAAAASMMVVKDFVRTDADEDGITETLAQYHAIGRVQ